MVYYRSLSPWPPRSLIARLSSYRPSFSSAWLSVAMETCRGGAAGIALMTNRGTGSRSMV